MNVLNFVPSLLMAIAALSYDRSGGVVLLGRTGQEVLFFLAGVTFLMGVAAEVVYRFIEFKLHNREDPWTSDSKSDLAKSIDER